MSDLIAALTIFRQYVDVDHPTVCMQRLLVVRGIGETVPSEEDRQELRALGFHYSSDYEGWYSYRFGSAQ